MIAKFKSTSRTMITLRQVSKRFLSIILALALLWSNNGSVVMAADLSAPIPHVVPSISADVVKRSNPSELTKPQRRAQTFSAHPADLEIRSSRVFFEPLAPMDSRANNAENIALASALTAFQRRSDSEDLSSLTNFIAAHPNSRWRVALQAELAEQYLERGYLSKALSYFASAWESSKTQTQQDRKAVADRAISSLVLLEAKLGLTTELQGHLKSIATRAFTGSSAQRVNDARTGLAMMKSRPDTSFKCGPYALFWLAESLNPSHTPPAKDLFSAAKFPSSKRGTSLAQLLVWSKEVGLNLQMAKRNAGAKVIAPAIMHWKISHFAMIGQSDGGRYRVQDSTFGDTPNFVISPKAIDAESDGYFLVPAGPLPTGWRAVGLSEAENVWGKGAAVDKANGKTPAFPRKCPGKCGGPPPDGGPGCGMPQAWAFTMNAELNIVDRPLTYRPPIGPEMAMVANYNQNEGNQPGTFTFPNLGFNWSLNWVSYITFDASKNATIRVRGGGYEVYTNTGTVGSPAYANPNVTSQAKLIVVGAGSYQRQLPDGSVENFTLSDGTNTYMTSVADPQANAAVISFDVNYRITQLTDASNNAITFSYVSNTVGNVGFYKIAGITDAFGRSAAFGYDSTTTYLTSITDAASNQSTFFWDTTSSFISMMTTPYGSTSFYRYVPAQSNGNGNGLRFTFPDGSRSVIENRIQENRMTAFWDREATGLYPMDPSNLDYSHAQTTKFDYETVGALESPVQKVSKRALEAPVVYFYDGESQNGPQYDPKSNKPAHTVQSLGEYRYTLTLGGTVTTGNSIRLQITDPIFLGVGVTPYYVVKSTDTSLSILAASFAAHINSYFWFQNMGYHATASGNTIVVSSLSPFPEQTTMVPDVGGGTETITVSAGSNLPKTGNITGTVTAGDTISVTVTDSGLSGGSKIVTYTVESGDTLASITQKMALALNKDTALQAINVSAFWSAPTTNNGVLTIFSNSTNTTTYSSSTSGGATEVFALTSNADRIIGVGGTLVTGTVFLTITDSALPGGFQTVGYGVVAGTDTYTTVAQGLANAVNANTNLSSAGISASWTNNRFLTVKSNSANVTSYSYNGNGNVLLITTNLVQKSSYLRNALGYATEFADPVGRTFKYSYAANNIDLLTMTENQNTDNFQLGLWQYGTTPHKPTLYVNGSGEQTQYTYNSAGELATVVDANSNTTTLSYNSNGYLTQINGPLSGSQDITTFTFFGYGLPQTVTNSQGYVVTYSYDGLNRQTAASYPDGTSEKTIYSKLDPVMQSDRLGRWTQRSFDVMDQLACETDPLGRQTKYCWCTCGSLSSLTDPAGNKTSWSRDLDARVIQKTYADGTSYQYSYLTTRPLVRTRTDALNQVSTYSYNTDDSLQSKVYTNAVNSTSPASTVYDTAFSRVTRQSNGWGDINYQYNPYIGGGSNKAYLFVGGYPQTPNATDTINITFTNSNLNGGAPWAMPVYNVVAGDAGNPTAVATHLAAAITANTTLSTAGISATSNGTLVTVSSNTSAVTVSPSGSGSTTATLGGGGRVAQVTNSVITNSPISYSYDSLDRTVNRMINGANNKITWAFDAMSRVTSELNALGATPFTYSYVDDTSGSSKGDPRLASISYPNSQTTAFAYLPTIQDERLQQIKNLTPTSTLLSQFNYAYNSPGEIKQWQQQQNATNSHYDLGYDFASQLTSAVTDSGSAFKVYITGTVHTGDVLSVTAYDASLTGSSGQETASYTVVGGDTIGSITTNLTSAINTAMSNISVTASANTSKGIVSISTSPSFTTSFRVSTSGGATTKLSVSESVPIANLHKQYYYAYDCAGNRTGAQGDSSGSLGTALTTTATKYSYNNVNELVGIAAGGPITFAGSTTNPIKQASVNVAQTVTIGGTITAGNTVGILVHDKGLSQARKVAYSVQGGDTTTTIATALKNAIQADSTLSAIGVSATSASNVITITSQSGNATTYSAYVNTGGTETVALGTSASSQASIRPSTAFTALPSLASGSNSVTVSAVSGGGTKTSNSPYSITISSGSSSTLSYDNNGNLISDGTNTYSWDAENRLIKITYPGSGQTSTFSYDALGRNVKIVEAGSTSGTKQFVWCDKERCEERDGSGTLTKQFFSRGEVMSGTAYFFTFDHIGSVREMSHMSGSTFVLDSQFAFDPYGKATQVAGTGATPDFSFGGMYFHSRSGQNLTFYRAYQSSFARWLSRDPRSSRDSNLYEYAGNSPINNVDPYGDQFLPLPLPMPMGIPNPVPCVGCGGATKPPSNSSVHPHDPPFPPGLPPDPDDLPRRNACEASCAEAYKDCWEDCDKIYPHDCEERRKCKWLCWFGTYIPCIRKCR